MARMRARKLAFGWRGAVALALVLGTAPVVAQPANVKQEARERFDRGLTLFNQRDDGGALAEFQRAYELVPHPLVLYNIALVQAAMNRPVQAVDSLDKLLAAPGSLDAERVEHAKKVRAEQTAKIGLLDVKVNVEGATIEIDNVSVGTTPLSAPLRVSGGVHLVAAVAPGHIPARREVSLAGGGRASVSFELEPLAGALSHLTVSTPLPGAKVVVDGKVVGTTPLAAALALAPGEHTVELHREGYLTARQLVNLGEGTLGQVELNPAVDQAALSATGGRLVLKVSEPEAVVFVNGAPRGKVAGALTLPSGKQRITVKRAGFFDVERLVDVPRGSLLTVSIPLEPTPDTRASYVSRTTTQRTVGWAMVGGGALLLGGGIGLALWNRGQEEDADAKWSALDKKFDDGGQCDPKGATTKECELLKQDEEIAYNRLQSVSAREKFFWIGAGVGAASLVVGSYLLISNDDPERYEPKSESDVFGRVRALPVVLPMQGGGGLGVVGVF